MKLKDLGKFQCRLMISNIKLNHLTKVQRCKMFCGSQWNLVPNNNTGSYALAGGGDCPL